MTYRSIWALASTTTIPILSTMTRLRREQLMSRTMKGRSLNRSCNTTWPVCKRTPPHHNHRRECSSRPLMSRATSKRNYRFMNTDLMNTIHKKMQWRPDHIATIIAHDDTIDHRAIWVECIVYDHEWKHDIKGTIMNTQMHHGYCSEVSLRTKLLYLKWRESI